MLKCSETSWFAVVLWRTRLFVTDCVNWEEAALSASLSSWSPDVAPFLLTYPSLHLSGIISLDAVGPGSVKDQITTGVFTTHFILPTVLIASERTVAPVWSIILPTKDIMHSVLMLIILWNNHKTLVCKGLRLYYSPFFIFVYGIFRWEVINCWHRQEAFVSIKHKTPSCSFLCVSGSRPTADISGSALFLAHPCTFLIYRIWMEIRPLNINDK